MPGSATLAVEITHVSRHGFWLLLDNEELVVPFADFPWFKQATIEQLLNVTDQVDMVSAVRGEDVWIRHVRHIPSRDSQLLARSVV